MYCLRMFGHKLPVPIGCRVLQDAITFEDWGTLEHPIIFDTSFVKAVVMLEEKGIRPEGSRDLSYFGQYFKAEDIQWALDNYESRWGKPNHERPGFWKDVLPATPL